MKLVCLLQACFRCSSKILRIFLVLGLSGFIITILDAFFEGTTNSSKLIATISLSGPFSFDDLDFDRGELDVDLSATAAFSTGGLFLLLFFGQYHIIKIIIIKPIHFI